MSKTCPLLIDGEMCACFSRCVRFIKESGKNVESMETGNRFQCDRGRSASQASMSRGTSRTSPRSLLAFQRTPQSNDLWNGAVVGSPMTANVMPKRKLVEHCYTLLCILKDVY